MAAEDVAAEAVVVTCQAEEEADQGEEHVRVAREVGKVRRPHRKDVEADVGKGGGFGELGRPVSDDARRLVEDMLCVGCALLPDTHAHSPHRTNLTLVPSASRTCTERRPVKRS